MGALGRQDDLLRQIPEDVKERTRKAGVTDVDWYAGRLTSSESKGFSKLPPKRHQLLRSEAKERRKERREQKTSELVAPITGAVAWLRGSLRRSPRHAR